MSPVDDDNLFDRRQDSRHMGDDRRELELTRGQARTIRALLRAHDQPVPADLVSGLGIVDPLETIEHLRQGVSSRYMDDDQPPAGQALPVPLSHLRDPDAGLTDGTITRDEARSIRGLLHKLDEPVPADIRELGIADPPEYIRGLRDRLDVNLDDRRVDWIHPRLDREPQREEEDRHPRHPGDIMERGSFPCCWPYDIDTGEDE